ncbi:MAG: hypothetical protein ACTIM4_14750 [Marinomonas sp.]
MNDRTVSTIEFSIGGIFLTMSLAFLIYASLSSFEAQGGVLETLLGVYFMFLSLPWFVAGWFHRKQKRLFASLAYIPIVVLILLLVDQII